MIKQRFLILALLAVAATIGGAALVVRQSNRSPQGDAAAQVRNEKHDVAAVQPSPPVATGPAQSDNSPPPSATVDRAQRGNTFYYRSDSLEAFNKDGHLEINVGTQQYRIDFDKLPLAKDDCNSNSYRGQSELERPASLNLTRGGVLTILVDARAGQKLDDDVHERDRIPE